MDDIHGATAGGGGGGGHLPRAWGGAVAIARQKATERQMTFFAASLCGLMGIFIILHWSRVIFSNAAHSPFSSVPLATPIGAITR